jgi:tetratricopeptide (TPR) repeat protein
MTADSVSAASVEDPKTLIEQGLRARGKGDHAGALARFEAAVAADPRHVDAQCEAACELCKLSRFDEAEAMFRRLLAHAPQTVRAMVELGYLLRERSRPAEAEAMLKQAIVLAPRNARALLGLGRLARQRGERAGALAYWESAAAAEPANVAAQLEIATELTEQGQFDEARRRIAASLATNPANGWAWRKLGLLERRRGDRAAALDAFNRALAMAADGSLKAAAQLEIATELTEQGQFDEARRRIAASMAMNPANGWAWRRLGLLERRRGDRAAALDAFNRALAATAVTEPLNAVAQLELATEFKDQGQFGEARRRIAAVLEADGANAAAWLGLGQVERRMGNRQAALDAFRQAATRDPHRARALVEIAIEQRALGQPGESERTLQRSLEIEPDHLGTLMQMAEHASLAGNDRESLAICHRAIAAHPGALGPYLSASRAAAGLGNAEEALALLDRAAETVEPQPEIAAQRIDLLRQAGEWEAARTVLDECAAQIPSSFPLWAQRFQLDLASGAYESAADALRDPPAASIDQQARVLIFRGQLAETKWRLDEAIGHYRAALARDPNQPHAHAELSRIYLLRCDVDAAADHLSASVRLGTSMRLLRGASLNASQTFVGQVLNEFVIDRAAMDVLKGLQALAPGERVVPLQALIRQNAEHTPSAICLLIAMRQAGLLSRPAAPAAKSAEGGLIPKQIVQYWDAAAPPEHVAAIMQSWSEANPDYRYTRFDDKAARDFIAAHYPPDVVRAYVRARHAAQKSDIFRLAHLAAEGGVYADADDRCLAPIGTIVPPWAKLVLYQEHFGTIGNNFIAASPKQPLIASALDSAVEAVNRGDTDIVWLSTGPGMLTRVFARLLSEHPQRPAWLKQTVVLDRGDLFRAVAIQCQLQYKKTNKHWSRGAFRNKSGSSQQ